jgi:hypothetical protein
MSKKIENPAECEVRAVIRVLNAQNFRPIEIYRQLIAVYEEGATNESNVRKWCRKFNESRTKVHEERSGRPSFITEDLKNRIDQHIKTNWHFTLDEIHEKFHQISHSVNFNRTDILGIQNPNYRAYFRLGGILNFLTHFYILQKNRKTIESASNSLGLLLKDY